MSLEPNAAWGVQSHAAWGSHCEERTALLRPAPRPVGHNPVLFRMASPVQYWYQTGDKRPKERVVGLRIGGAALPPAGVNWLRSTGVNACLHQPKGGRLGGSPAR